MIFQPIIDDMDRLYCDIYAVMYKRPWSRRLLDKLLESDVYRQPPTLAEFIASAEYGEETPPIAIYYEVKI